MNPQTTPFQWSTFESLKVITRMKHINLLYLPFIIKGCLRFLILDVCCCLNMLLITTLLFLVKMASLVTSLTLFLS